MHGRVDAPVVGVAVGAVAAICCAGLPAIAGVLGGITIAAALGVASGVLAIAAAAGASLLLVRARRRRSRRRTPRPSSDQ